MANEGSGPAPRELRGSTMLTSSYTEAEDEDPRAGLVNLADVMLVFACGLMLALVSFWNLDISAMQEILTVEDVTEVSDIEGVDDLMHRGVGSGYNELGIVYEDPMTGKLYMLTEDLERKDEE